MRLNRNSRKKTQYRRRVVFIDTLLGSWQRAFATGPPRIILTGDLPAASGLASLSAGRKRDGGQDSAGSDRRQRWGYMVGAFPLAGVTGELGCGVDGGLHHQSRERRGGAPGVGCPAGLRRLAQGDRLARDRRGRSRRARPVALRAGQSGAGGGKERLLRMAARADNGGGGGTGGTVP